MEINYVHEQLHGNSQGRTTPGPPLDRSDAISAHTFGVEMAHGHGQHASHGPISCMQNSCSERRRRAPPRDARCIGRTPFLHTIFGTKWALFVAGCMRINVF